jgi:hypothetical protein
MWGDHVQLSCGDVFLAKVDAAENGDERVECSAK